MFVRIPHFRPVLAVAAFWLVTCWYLYGRTGVTNSVQPPTPGIGTNNAGKHISKLPERYPVTSLRPLPTGPATVRIPTIQRQPPPAEDAAGRKTRLARLRAVQASFQHSWDGYKAHAWLSDEVTPLTGRRKDPFGGWAATLVDALDTLWIMGLKDDFREAVKACEQIDFTTTRSNTINVFETTIRYLGGFLAAYELSEKLYPSLLRKAVEVAELLMGAFDTPNRMPIARWGWKEYAAGKAQVAAQAVLVSELGSLTLEFTKLSQLSGEAKYYDAVQRISDEFEKSQNTTKLPGMWPITVNAAVPSFQDDGSFSLGGMSDSLYEYLPKQYLLLGGVLEQPRKMYEGFIDVAKKYLFHRVMIPSDMPVLMSGDIKNSGTAETMDITSIPKSQHLTCFVGGMIGLGARIFDREEEMRIAIEMTNGCVWSYNCTASGIGPEIFQFVPCGGIEDSRSSEECSWDEAKWKAAVRAYYHSTKDNAAKKPVAQQQAVDEDTDRFIQVNRLPPGMVDVPDRKYILRPEAIESVFIMYRLTGDATWMDKAWDMFLHIEAHTRTKIASASLADVTLEEPRQIDSMESFWLAETLKYFFLIYSDWDVVDLDEWVLNTEAHPLRRMDVQS